MSISFDERVKKAMLGGATCIFCQKEERKEKQNYGPLCEAMVKGAFRDAAAQGAHASKALSLLKRKSGPEYVQAVMVYHSRCQAAGRGSKRPAFEWVQMWMAVEMKSSTRMGTKFLWVTRGYYKWLRKRDHEETDVQAEASWLAEFHELLAQHKCATTNRILFNVEDFVIMED